MFPVCKGCLAVVGLLFASNLAAFDKAQEKEAAVEKTAKAFVALLDKGDFDKATGDFDEAMLKALPADKLKGTWEKVVGDAGAFKKQLSSRVEKSGKYDVVIVTCEFQKKKLDARVVFNKDGKITGLFFKPSRPTGKEEIFEGTLKVGGIEIRLVFHLFKQTDGTYLGTMDSPDQGAKDIPLDEVSVKDDDVRLELKRAKMVYEGKRDKDGKEIAGNLQQGGQTFPLTLKKVAKVKGSGSRYGTTVLKVGQRAGSNGTSGLLPSLHGSAPLVWPCSARWCPPVACGTSRSYATLHPQPGLGGSCQS